MHTLPGTHRTHVHTLLQALGATPAQMSWGPQERGAEDAGMRLAFPKHKYLRYPGARHRVTTHCVFCQIKTICNYCHLLLLLFHNRRWGQGQQSGHSSGNRPLCPEKEQQGPDTTHISLTPCCPTCAQSRP